MHRFLKRMRGMGRMMALTLLMQTLALGLCALPETHAATVSPAAMHESCPMDVPAGPMHGMPACDHCQEPDAAIGAIPAPDAPALAILAVLPEPRQLAASVSELPRAFALAEQTAPPDSSALIFHTSLRIRI